MRAAGPLALATASLAGTGCMGMLEAGYTNRAALNHAGGASFVARGSAGDVRGETRVVPDFAVRGDVASSGNRFALGAGATAMTQPGWKHDWTPFGRAALWLSPFRGGPARPESVLAAGLDAGAMFYPSRSSHNRRFFEAGARADYAHHADGFGSSLVWTVYVGVGTSASLVIPR